MNHLVFQPGPATKRGIRLTDRTKKGKQYKKKFQVWGVRESRPSKPRFRIDSVGTCGLTRIIQKIKEVRKKFF